MPHYRHLIELYRKRGFEIASGLSPAHFKGWREVAFTWLMKQGKPVTLNLGIAQQELFLLLQIFADWQPRRVFIVGNSFGWSTLALALMLPEARVVALDAAMTPDTEAGLALTNLIAKEEKLNAIAVKGLSPQDVGKTVENYLGGPVDFALIDGNHTVQSALADFRALRQLATPDCLYLFHDVVNFRLQDAVKSAQSESGLAGQLLSATPSGIAALFDRTHCNAGVQATLAAFAPSREALEALNREFVRRQKLAEEQRAKA